MCTVHACASTMLLPNLICWSTITHEQQKPNKKRKCCHRAGTYRPQWQPKKVSLKTSACQQALQGRKVKVTCKPQPNTEQDNKTHQSDLCEGRRTAGGERGRRLPLLLFPYQSLAGPFHNVPPFSPSQDNSAVSIRSPGIPAFQCCSERTRVQSELLVNGRSLTVLWDKQGSRGTCNLQLMSSMTVLKPQAQMRGQKSLSTMDAIVLQPHHP